MSPAAIGPVKAMMLALDAGKLATLLDDLSTASGGGVAGDSRRQQADRIKGVVRDYMSTSPFSGSITLKRNIP